MGNHIKDTNVIVGNIDVNVDDSINNYCNVGYTIRYNYQNNGYATEALKVVSDYLLNNRKYYLVECNCNVNNIASSSVMKNAVFIKDGYIKERRLNKDNTYSCIEYYSKRKKEYNDEIKRI